MDISDGLLGDLGKMLRLTGITMNLQTKDVPLSDAARECLELNPYLIETVLTGGDDYEILCSIPPEKAEAFEADIERRGMYMNRIGRAIDGSSSIKVMDESGNLLVFPAHSFQHF
jgi:thiamine-monophosphate kinase